MAQTPQVSSNPGLAQLQAPAGNALQKQTGSGETFASLLAAQGGDVTGAVSDSPAGAAQTAAVAMRSRTPGKGQQGAQLPQTGSSEPSGTASGERAAKSQPSKSDYTRFPGGEFHFARVVSPPKE